MCQDCLEYRHIESDGLNLKDGTGQALSGTVQVDQVPRMSSRLCCDKQRHLAVDAYAVGADLDGHVLAAVQENGSSFCIELLVDQEGCEVTFAFPTLDFFGLEQFCLDHAAKLSG